MSDTYILKDGKTIPEPDLMTWARWFETANRHIGDTAVGDVRVSTVFLGMDHNFGSSAEPILFETMIFGGKYDGHCERYATEAEARAGHNLAIKMAEEV